MAEPSASASMQDILNLERLCDQSLEGYWNFNHKTGHPIPSIGRIAVQVESCQRVLRALQRQQDVEWGDLRFDSLRETLEQCVEIFEGSASGGSGYGSSDVQKPKKVDGIFKHFRDERKYKKLSKTLEGHTLYMDTLQLLLDKNTQAQHGEEHIHNVGKSTSDRYGPAGDKSQRSINTNPKNSALNVHDLKELIRKRLALDVQIYTLRNCPVKYRPVVEGMMRESDAALIAIKATLQLWDSGERWESEGDFETLVSIKRRLGEERYWADNLLWESSIDETQAQKEASTNAISCLAHDSKASDEEDINRQCYLDGAQHNPSVSVDDIYDTSDEKTEPTGPFTNGRQPISDKNYPTNAEVDGPFSSPQDDILARRHSDASSIASATESIFSIISGTSMSSVMGIAIPHERLTDLLLEDAKLYSLFIEGCSSLDEDRFERNLRKLILQLAVDLRIEAGNQTQKGAAYFIRSRARNTAHDICSQISHSFDKNLNINAEDSDGQSDDSSVDKEENNDDEAGFDHDKSQISQPFGGTLQVNPDSSESSDELESLQLESTDNNDGLSDDSDVEDEDSDEEDGEAGINYDQIELFIKSSTAFALFRSSLERFIHPEEQTKVTGFDEKYEADDTKPSYFNFSWYIRLWEPSVPDGHYRVRWNCSCGTSIYDDFEELEEGGIKRLEMHLNNVYSNTSTTATTTTTTRHETFQTLANLLSATFKGIRRLTGHKNNDLLPQHRSPTSAASSGPSPNYSRTADLLFLLLCHNHGLFATKLLQLDLSSLDSDKSLFMDMRKKYKALRGKMWSFLSFRTLTSIKFVQFELYETELVDVRKQNVLPPLELEGREYRYLPKPPDVVPPVGRNHLMHLFQCPQDARRSICLDRFPKKLREPLKVSDDTGTGTGWGLQLEEGWDKRKTWQWLSLVLLVGSVIWGIVWSVFKHSIQDAFAVSGYMVAATVLSVGFVQAMAENRHSV